MSFLIYKIPRLRIPGTVVLIKKKKKNAVTSKTCEEFLDKFLMGSILLLLLIRLARGN